MRNPILYIPDIAMTLVNALLLYTLYQYTGVDNLFQILKSAEAFTPGILSNYLSSNLEEIIFSIIFFFFFNFIFGVGVIIFKFTMISELLLKKKVSLHLTWKEKKGYFWPVVFLRIFIYLTGIVSLGIIFGASYILFLVFSLFLPQTIASYLSIGIGIILAISSIVYIKLATLFRYPLMFLEKKRNAFHILKKSFCLLNQKPRFVIKTALVVLIMVVFFYLGTYVLTSLGNVSISFITITLLATICTVLLRLAMAILNLTIDLWSTIFVFLRYKETTKE